MWGCRSIHWVPHDHLFSASFTSCGFHGGLPLLHERKCRQELRQRPRKNGAYYFVPSGFLGMSFCATPNHQLRVPPPIMGWAIPRQSLIKKRPHRPTYRLISWRQFLKRGSLFPTWCHIHRELISIRSTFHYFLDAQHSNALGKDVEGNSTASWVSLFPQASSTAALNAACLSRPRLPQLHPQ